MELFTRRHQVEKEVDDHFNNVELTKTETAKAEIIIPETHDAMISEDENKTTTLDSLIQNHESQIKLGLAHDKSLSLLSRSIDILGAKLDEVNASRLPAVVMAASKVVESIRKERLEARKTDKDREVHYHFYTPQQKKVEEFEIIDVQ